MNWMDGMSLIVWMYCMNWMVEMLCVEDIDVTRATLSKKTGESTTIFSEIATIPLTTCDVSPGILMVCLFVVNSYLY